jgi:hypothetical protein
MGLYSLLQASRMQSSAFHVRRNNKVNSFVMIKGHVICAHLGFNIVAIQRQLVGIQLLIMEMEGITIHLHLVLHNQSQSQSYVTTDGQPASLSWNKAPI